MNLLYDSLQKKKKQISYPFFDQKKTEITSMHYALCNEYREFKNHH